MNQIYIATRIPLLQYGNHIVTGVFIVARQEELMTVDPVLFHFSQFPCLKLRQ